MQALSQLSYSPKPVVGGHCNAEPLVVSCGRETEVDERLPLHQAHGQVVRLIELVAPGDEGVRVGRAVGAADIAARR